MNDGLDVDDDDVSDVFDFTWGYRIFEDEKGLYGLAEVYYDRTGKIVSWTNDNRDLPGGYDEPDDVIIALEMMLNSAKKHKENIIKIHNNNIV